MGPLGVPLGRVTIPFDEIQLAARTEDAAHLLEGGNLLGVVLAHEPRDYPVEASVGQRKMVAVPGFELQLSGHAPKLSGARDQSRRPVDAAHVALGHPAPRFLGHPAVVTLEK